MTEPNADATIPPAVKQSLLPAVNTDLPPDTPWWAKILISSASQGWKFLSVNVPVFVAGVIEIDQASGGQLMQLVPDSWKPHVVAVGCVVVAALRFINQKKGQQ